MLASGAFSSLRFDMPLSDRFDRMVANWLRSKEAKREIRSQISDALVSDALAPRVEEITAKIWSEVQAGIDWLKSTSDDVRIGVARALKQEAERVQSEVVAQVTTFLRSAEGKELLIDLLIEALSRAELALLIRNAETRLKEVAADEIATLAAHAEIAVKISSEVH